MKKFFKSLAVVLALVLVVGAIPASAAEKATLTKTSKIIYVGGSEQSKTKSYYNVAKAVKGNGVVTLESEGDDIYFHIGTTAKTASKVYAQNWSKLGACDVTVLVDDEEIGTIKINVKKNATDLTVDGIADGAEFTVGDEVLVKLPAFKGDERQDTDLRAIAESDCYTVVDNGNRTFTLTFTKAGEAAVKAYAYQSAAFNAETAAKTVNVVVKEAAKTVVATKQLNTKKFQIEFNQDVAYTTADFGSSDVYYLANNVLIPLGTSVKKVASEGKVTTFEFWTDLLPNRTYYVNLPAFDVPAKVVVGKYVVDHFTVASDDKVVAEEGKAVKYTAFNADDVDITSYVSANFNFYDTSVVEGEGAYVSSDKKVYFTEIDKYAKIKFVYMVLDENSNPVQDATTGEFSYVEAYAEYKSVKKADAVKTAEYKYTFNGGLTADKNNYVANKWNRDLTIYVDNGDTFDGTEVYTLRAMRRETIDGQLQDPAEITFAATAFKYTTADPQIAVVRADETIVGIKEGKTTILISQYDSNTDSWFYVDNVDLVVKAANKIDRVAAKLSKTNLNLSADSDSLKLIVTVYDKYNNVITNANVDFAANLTWVEDENCVTNIATATFGAFSYNSNDKTYEAVINDNNVTRVTGVNGARPLTGLVKFNRGNQELKSNKVNFTIDNKTGRTPSVTISKTALNTGYVYAKNIGTDYWKTNVTTADVKIELVDGIYHVGWADAENLTAVPSKNATSGAAVFANTTLSTTEQYYYIVTKNNGSPLTNVTTGAALIKDVTTPSAGIVSFKNIDSAGNQLGNGTYRVIVYGIKLNASNPTGAVVMRTIKELVLNVTKSDPVWSVEKISDRYGAGYTISYNGNNAYPVTNPEDCFVVKFNGEVVDSNNATFNSIQAESTNDGRTYVRSIKYNIKTFVDGPYDATRIQSLLYTIPVGALIDGNGSQN